MARRRKYGRLVTIFQRKVRGKRGSWIARWTDPFTGLQRQVSLSKEEGIDTKEQATEWLGKKSEELHEQRKKARARGRTGNARQLWAQVLEAHLAALTAERGEAAAKARRRSMTAWLSWLETQPYCRCGADLNVSHLEAFHAYLNDWKDRKRHAGNYVKSGAPVTAATRNHYRANTLAMLNWARRKGYLIITSDDIRDAMPKFAGIRKLPRDVRAETLSAILVASLAWDSQKHFASRDDKAAYDRGAPSAKATHVHEPLTELVLLLMLTGMRLGEALHLRWDSVDLRFRTMRVEADPLTGWAPKTRHERVIPLGDSPALLSLLRILKGRAGEGRYVLAGADPQRPRNFHRPAWGKLMASAGAAGVAPKHMRSTWVTAMAHGRGGPNAQELALRAGHGVEVAARHYVAQAYARPGNTVEQWLGINKEAAAAVKAVSLRV